MSRPRRGFGWWFVHLCLAIALILFIIGGAAAFAITLVYVLSEPLGL